jgi:two-component system, OmpR family, phosphate regulon sensor histidine kinase PhoR
MTIGLSGIILIQILWMKKAIHVQNEQFDNTVTNVMSNVVEKMESAEVVLFFSQSYGGLVSDTAYQEEAQNMAKILSYMMNDSSLYKPNKNEYVDFVHDTIIPISKSDMQALEQEIGIVDNGGYRNKEMQSETDLSGYYLQQSVSNQTERISEFMNQILYSYNIKNQLIQERIDPKLLEDFIFEELQNNAIAQKCEFAVISTIDSSIIHSSDGFINEYINTEYRTSLYPNDVFRKSYSLLLYFPSREYIIFRPILYLLIASVAFSMILVVIFSLSIYVIIRQKKVSEIKTAFINNMTHEFKTPIATIRLASDSIENPKVIENPKMIKQFSEMIKNETKRMDRQVEKVLQMALVEKSYFSLEAKKFFVNEMINTVLKPMKLQMEKAGVQLSYDDQSTNDAILTEEVHFLNIISNILDNAIKYAKESPEISIITKNVGENVVISIEDNGIGMGKEIQHKIFDKFYRVESGNVHNIKGFGLGLSYVKAVVDAHNGQISVKSELKIGTKFEISIPVFNG